MITLNRPDAKNAIDAGMTEGLMIAIERIKATPSIRIVFLTGAGPMFCAGGDPKGFQARPHAHTCAHTCAHTRARACVLAVAAWACF